MGVTEGITVPGECVENRRKVCGKALLLTSDEDIESSSLVGATGVAKSRCLATLAKVYADSSESCPESSGDESPLSVESSDKDEGHIDVSNWLIFLSISHTPLT